VAKYRATLFPNSFTIQRKCITRLVSSLKPRTKQAPICSMLIRAICSHILKDNQAAFNANYIDQIQLKSPASFHYLLSAVCKFSGFIFTVVIWPDWSLCKFDIRPNLNTFTGNIFFCILLRVYFYLFICPLHFSFAKIDISLLLNNRFKYNGMRS